MQPAHFAAFDGSHGLGCQRCHHPPIDVQRIGAIDPTITAIDASAGIKRCLPNSRLALPQHAADRLRSYNHAGIILMVARVCRLPVGRHHGRRLPDVVPP
jgi:hypothetical protein